MDRNVAALLDTMKQLQQQFVEALNKLTQPEPVAQTVTSRPKFENFDKSREKWDQYILRFKEHLKLHNVTEQEKKRAFLLSCLGPKIFDLLQNLMGSSNVSDQSFDTFIEKLSAHFKVSTRIQAARYSFYNCMMKPGQSYSEWVATLRGIAKVCQFICKSNACNHCSYVDEQIRDVII